MISITYSYSIKSMVISSGVDSSADSHAKIEKRSVNAIPRIGMVCLILFNISEVILGVVCAMNLPFSYMIHKRPATLSQDIKMRA